MRIGISFDLKSDFAAGAADPEDRFEEYDSDATVAAIEGALRQAGYDTVRLGGGRALLEHVLAAPPDLVFNICEGVVPTRSREAHVPAVLEMLGIPHTHSDPLTLALTLDKAAAKRVVMSMGVPSPRFAVIDDPAQARHVALDFPVIAKPLFEGSSIGVRKKSRVTDRAALAELVGRLLADYKEPVLVEEFCPGPEMTVGVIGNGAEARILGVMEISPRLMKPEEFVYSLEVKRNYETEVEYHVPPKRPRELVAKVEQTALDAYRALGCRDVARVDVRIGADGEPKFLEVNPLPGINPVTGDIVILSRAGGVEYATLIAEIVMQARRRYGL
jgi:D-alanine-D-alanine ligase